MKERKYKCCVYALSDPRDGRIYYIGATKEFVQRMIHHDNVASWGEHTIEYFEWRKELMILNLHPNLGILAICNEENLFKYERIWINAAVESGQPLTNSGVTGKPADVSRKAALVAEFNVLRVNLGMK